MNVPWAMMDIIVKEILMNVKVIPARIMPPASTWRMTTTVSVILDMREETVRLTSMTAR